MREQILRELTEKRDQCVKHFRMSEKGVAAAVYPEPVHYEENGEWKEIDNRLESATEEGREIFTNKASDMKVRFASEAGDGDLVSVEKNGMKVSWEMEDPGDSDSGRARKKKCKFRVLTKEDHEEMIEFPENTENEKGIETQKNEEETLDTDSIWPMLGVKNLVGEGIYEEILDGADVQYIVQGQRLKENICLKNPEAAQQTLAFRFRHPGLQMQRQQEARQPR